MKQFNGCSQKPSTRINHPFTLLFSIPIGDFVNLVLFAGLSTHVVTSHDDLWRLVQAGLARMQVGISGKCDIVA